MEITEREKRLTAENVALSEAVRKMLDFIKTSHQVGRVSECGVVTICQMLDEAVDLATTRSTLAQIRYDLFMRQATKLQVSAVSSIPNVDDYTSGYRQASMDIAHEMMRAAHEYLK